LLPARLPDIEGFELAVEYRSAGADTEIGGDFYDVTPSVGDDVAVTVGDVCGHDIEAATSTGIVRHTIAAASQHLRDPSEVVRWANDALLASVDDHRFVTVVHAHLARRPEGGATCSLVLAGHPPPLLVPGDGSAVREIGRPGTVLGTMHPLRLATVDFHLEAGDRLVFFTDGLFENPNPRLDLSDLLALVGDCGRAGADRLLRDLMDRYDDLTIRTDVDDVAVLVVGVT
jgi:serine phosphatase RsbU (regulator of sigma subunit)